MSPSEYENHIANRHLKSWILIHEYLNNTQASSDLFTYIVLTKMLGLEPTVNHNKFRILFYSILFYSILFYSILFYLLCTSTRQYITHEL